MPLVIELVSRSIGYTVERWALTKCSDFLTMFSDLYLCVGSLFSCHCLDVHRYQCSVQPLLATSSQTFQYYFVPISKLLLKNYT